MEAVDGSIPTGTAFNKYADALSIEKAISPLIRQKHRAIVNRIGANVNLRSTVTGRTGRMDGQVPAGKCFPRVSRSTPGIKRPNGERLTGAIYIRLRPYRMMKVHPSHFDSTLSGSRPPI
jgi:hypothetical protein